MKIGLTLLYWPWFTLDEQIQLAELADEVGLDSVWVAESWGQDAVALLGMLASRTTNVRLGAGILQIPARQATTTAMAAATLDQISGGRMVLGLGLSGPQVSEGWYGVPFVSPLGRTREYVEIVRRTWSGEHVAYRGKHWQLPSEGGTGLGRPLKMLGSPPTDIPVYLAVNGPKTVEQAGRIADGWLPFLYAPDFAEELNAPLLAGIDAAGRGRDAVSVSPMVFAAVDDDIAKARDVLRPIIALYLGGMGAPKQNFYVQLATRCGFGAAAAECQERFLAGDKDGAAACLPAELIGQFALTATPETFADEVDRYRRAGVDELIVAPFGDRQALVRRIAALRAG